MFKRLAIGGVLALSACASPVEQGALGGPLQVGDATLEAMAFICGADQVAGKSFNPKLAIGPGMGTGGFKVDSQVKAAQDWFDFGMALSHAFYHEDAKLAMKRAVEADPQCARCAFGQAWALGPTLNYRIDEAERVAALAAAQRAKALVKPGDQMGQRLADAVVARYQKSERSTEPAFGQEMARIARAYPDEVEIAVLATHTLLIPVRSGDRSGLEPALAMLEAILKRRPSDTGAIHYYIHATEFDGRAEDALAVADRLGDLAPAASHLVHMPAHTFFRAGRYYDAAFANAQAIAVDAKWISGGGDVTGSTPQYYAHNLSFGLAGAMMAGDGPLALKLAEHAARVWPDNRPGSNVVARTWVALAIHDPDRALALAPQTAGTRQATYRAYARGEALVRRGDLEGVKAEVRALAPRENEAPEQAIARGVLEGRIAMLTGDPKKAAEIFEAAAKVQEARLASSWDPPSWWYPVRRSVAAAHLKAGDLAKAEAEARKSLASWKHDPFALWVLSEALSRQGKVAPAHEALAQARKIWRGDIERVGVDIV